MSRFLFLFVTFAAAACGSRPPPHPDDEPVLRQPVVAADGASACVLGATTHALGARFEADDGCNTCTCTADGVQCTKMACDAPTGHRFVVRFPRGSAVPDPDAVMVLGTIARALRGTPEDAVVVQGYATAVERRADGGLALRRAESAAARLRSLGVAADQITAEAGTDEDGAFALFRRVRR
ncbi:MAG: hypothetical protein R3F60_07830 [bacterium]